MPNKKNKKQKKFDWDAIEKEYRMGQKSLRTLSSEFGPTPAGISKHAKSHGWVQDKTHEVRSKTRAALLTDKVDNTVNTPTPADIDRAVRSNVQIIREHRHDIKKGRELVSLLSSQLEVAAGNRETIESDIYEDTKGDKKIDSKRRNAMMKAVSLPAHAGVLRDLSTALKNLIPLERQAFNIDDQGAGDEPDSIRITVNRS